MSQSKISRIETGRAVPTVFDVQAILRALDVPAQRADELMALARLANTEFRDFRSERRSGLHHLQSELETLERDACEIRFFLPTMLTGLLQTAEYARATDLGQHPKALARRLERQRVLFDESKRFTFLLTEAALRWPLLSHVGMALQLDRLASVNRLPTVRIGVTPFREPLPVSPLNPFTVYDDKLATAETIGGLVIMRNPKDVEIHLAEFHSFEPHSLWGGDATEFLSRLAEEFRARS
jgi:transcriptional regulator with XRE-family HTH domain